MRSLLLLLALSTPAGARPPQAPCPPPAPPVRADHLCVCGGSCRCDPGVCPARCPVAATPAPAPAEYYRGAYPAFAYPPATVGGRGYYMAYPAFGGCPGGACPR